MDERHFDDQLRTTLHSASKNKHADPELVARLLANARAQRTVVVPLRRRPSWLAPLLAAAAVATVVAGTAAAIHFAGAQHAAPATHQPNPSSSQAPITTSPPTSPTATHASTSAPPTTSKTATRPSTAPTLSGQWTDARVTITERSLGAVTRGMTLAQARAAAGTGLTTPGDGIYQPAEQALTGSTRLSLSWAVTCFDATRSGGGPGTAVTTAAGVRLGDPMSRVRTAYPQAVAFTADPSWTGPGNIPAGLLVQFNDGVLLFVGSTANGRDGTITSIRGAPDARTASSTFC